MHHAAPQSCLPLTTHVGSPAPGLGKRMGRYLKAVQGAFSGNTERAIRADVEIFTIWCEDQGFTALPACATTAIPSKRFVRKQVGFLNRDEVDALLDAPDRSSWSGRRDYAFILTAVQTGLRVSEIIQLGRVNLELGASAHLRVIGKGRKERCVPLAVSTRNVLKAWLLEPQRGTQSVLFPNRHGNPLTIHGVQYLLGKHHEMAVHQCPSLKHKRVTVHLLRHTTAMDLLQAEVDRSTIALWFGHASAVSTEPYIEATLAIKQKALAKVAPLDAASRRFCHGLFQTLVDVLKTMAIE